MTGKFEVYLDREGKHRFRLKDGNGDILLTSETYESKNSCLRGVESVKKNAEDAAILEIE
jgi:uncharacterized protein